MCKGTRQAVLRAMQAGKISTDKKRKCDTLIGIKLDPESAIE